MPTMTLSRRKHLALVILGISILAATYIAIPGEAAGVRQLHAEDVRAANMLVNLVDWLDRIEMVHVLGHLLIFGGVGMLLGPWGKDGQRGDFRLAMRYVMVGGLLMEAAQVIVGYSDDYITDLILGVSFDLLTDVISGLLAVGLVRYSSALSSK